MVIPGAARGVAQFDALYDRHARELYDYFVARTSDADLARDLVQETCLRLWRAITDVADLAAERQRRWLCTVARNLGVDEYRARASASAKRAAVTVLQRPDDRVAPGADVDLGSRESVREVDAAIARLPEPLREVLVL